MKTFAAALIGFSLMIGTVMAQTPAASSSTTDTTKSTKVKKHKKHTPAANSNSGTTAPSSTPAPAK